MWLLDVGRQTMTPFLVGGSSRQAPIWTADGKRVIYRRTLDGYRNLYMKNVDGSGDEVRLTNAPGVVDTPMSVSRDGRWLVLNSENRLSLMRIDAAATAAEREPRPFTSAEIGRNGRISPDGRWLAYQSAVSGGNEIYVRSFPDAGPRTQVSTEGGAEPLWSRDGRTLYFTTPDRKLMAAEVAPGATFNVRAPRQLPMPAFKESSNTNTPYDITADGRFLGVRQHTDANVLDRIDIVLNWFTQLPKR